MGYWDGLTDAAFKEDSSGRSLYYPWGIFGSGFILDTEQHTGIRNFIKRMYMIVVPAIIITQIVFGFRINLFLLPVYLVWYFFTVKKITRDLPRTEEKLGLWESFKNSAKSHNLVTLIVLEALSIGFVAIGIGMWIDTGSFISYALIGFFAFCSATLGYMIISKMHFKKELH